MCDPVSLTVLAVAATAVTAGGQIYAANAEAASQQYAAKVNDRNAKLAESAREDANRRGEQEQLRNWRKVSQRMGKQRAEFGALGLDLSFGTPADIQEDELMLGMEDASIIAENTQKEVKGFDIEAANYRDNAAMNRYNAKAAKTAGLISATGTLLAGASQVAKINYKPASAGG